MSTGAGVVAACRVAATGGAWRPLPDGWGLSDLYVAALELGLSDLFVREWFGAGAADLLALEGRSVGDDALDLGGGLRVAVTGDQPAPWRYRMVTPASYLCGPGAPGRVGGQVVNVVSLEADANVLAGPLWGLTPAELLRALKALERHLGVAWASSIGQTVQRLIRSTHPAAKGGRLLEAAPAPPAPVEAGNLEQPYAAWRRPLQPGEGARAWLHCFDANAQYLAAWQVTELGFGEVRHEVRPHFDPRTVGVWRVPTIGNLSVGGLLPEAWLGKREWFTTPTVARALEIAGQPADVLEVVEAWVWPEHARYLRGAGERLRDARQAALNEWSVQDAKIASWPEDVPATLVDEAVTRTVVAGVVRDAVKSLYTVGTGRFNMAREGGNRWARPDWGHMIRAQARVNLHRRLAGIPGKRDRLGAAPFAIATDALLFLSDEMDWRKFAALIRLPLGTGLGEFKHDATVPAQAVGRELLASGTVGGILERAGVVLEEHAAAGVAAGWLV